MSMTVQLLLVKSDKDGTDLTVLVGEGGHQLRAVPGIGPCRTRIDRSGGLPAQDAGGVALQRREASSGAVEDAPYTMRARSATGGRPPNRQTRMSWFVPSPVVCVAEGHAGADSVCPTAVPFASVPGAQLLRGDRREGPRGVLREHLDDRCQQDLPRGGKASCRSRSGARSGDRWPVD
jgi:hypothetical protein